MAITVTQIQSSIPGAVKRFKIYDPASGGTALATGANSVVLTGFSPMDLVYPLWQASHAYIIGDKITDSNGNIQTVTTAGTSGATHPVWATSSTTADGSPLVWTFYSLGRAIQYNNGLPDPYQVRLHAYTDIGLGSPAVTSATLDVGTWLLSLTDPTQTTINCTIFTLAKCRAVILEVPAE